jgi:hypothetical protein
MLKKGWMEGLYLDINKCVLHTRNYVTITTIRNFKLKERGGGGGGRGNIIIL